MVQSAAAQVFIQADEENGLVSLGNEKFRRVFRIDEVNHAFYTNSFKNELSGVDWCRPGSDEFAVAVDDQLVTAGASSKMFRYASHHVRTATAADGPKTLQVDLDGMNGTAAASLRVRLFYQIYPHLAVVRKWLEIENLGRRERKLSGLEWERVNLAAGWNPKAVVYSDYGHTMKPVPFLGGPEDPAVLLYFWDKAEGLVVGNEAPSVMKRTMVTGDDSRVSIAMNSDGSDLPFRKYLKPGEVFQSPKGFIVLYHGETWQNAFEGDFAAFVRQYLGVKLFERPRPPMFVYSPYVPFNADFSETLYTQLIDAAADSGVDCFQVTWAWSDDIEPQRGTTAQGDYLPSPAKFPNGLKPVIDHIKARGMKPCLYFSLANADRRGRVFKSHPEWAMLNKNGDPESLHQLTLKNGATMCFRLALV